MITFEKDVAKMSQGELRLELSATRCIIDDIYKLTKDSHRGQCETAKGKQNLINQIARYCYRKMPK